MIVHFMSPTPFDYGQVTDIVCNRLSGSSPSLFVCLFVCLEGLGGSCVCVCCCCVFFGGSFFLFFFFLFPLYLTGKSAVCFKI